MKRRKSWTKNCLYCFDFKRNKIKIPLGTFVVFKVKLLQNYLFFSIDGQITTFSKVFPKRKSTISNYSSPKEIEKRSWTKVWGPKSDSWKSEDTNTLSNSFLIRDNRMKGKNPWGIFKPPRSFPHHRSS